MPLQGQVPDPKQTMNESPPVGLDGFATMFPSESTITMRSLSVRLGLASLAASEEKVTWPKLLSVMADDQDVGTPRIFFRREPYTSLTLRPRGQRVAPLTPRLSSSPGRIRTSDISVNSRTLYRLSYRGPCGA